MAKLLKLRRGTTTQHNSFTGAEGECTVDMTKDTLVVHDGSTQGGHVLLREDMSNLPAGTIDNADINASAAIAGTKINPNFGSQSITTTGNIGCQALTTQGNMTINNTYPCLNLTDTDNNSDYQIRNNNGHFAIQDTTNSAQRFTIFAGGGAQFNGNLTVQGNLDANNGLDVTGNITTTGNATIDGNITVKDRLKIDNVAPIFHIYESDNNKNYYFVGDSNNLTIRMDGTAGADTITRWNSDGHVDFIHNVDCLSGLDVTGDITSTGNVSIADDKQLQLGASDDLIMFHQTSNNNSIIKEQGGGSLSIQTNGPSINFYDAANGTSMLIANTGGSVDLYNGSSKKLETKSTGVGITGSLDLSNDLNCSGNIYGPNNIGRDSGDKITWVDNTRMDLYVNGNNEFRFEADGDFHADGDVVAYSTTTASDSRLKSDIHTINDALGIVGKLRGVSYKWLRDGKADIGVIAQEVEEVVPEVVKTKTILGLDGEEEMKTVDYGKLVGVLINAINELKAELDEHKKGGK